MRVHQRAPDAPTMQAFSTGEEPGTVAFWSANGSAAQTGFVTACFWGATGFASATQVPHLFEENTGLASGTQAEFSAMTKHR